MHNSIWFADSSGAWTSDTYIQQQMAAADYLNLERGIASDSGLTGGTGFWSIYNFFNYVDKAHALGKGVNLMAYELNSAQQQYSLASYYLISNGSDFVGDRNTNPSNWWSGYSTELGTPVGPRSYSNGIFKRVFSGGMVLLGEPGLPKPDRSATRLLSDPGRQLGDIRRNFRLAGYRPPRFFRDRDSNCSGTKSYRRRHSVYQRHSAILLSEWMGRRADQQKHKWERAER